MTAQITAANGIVMKMGSGTSPETFTEIANVFNGPSGPGWSPQMIEARPHGSTAPTKKAVGVNIKGVNFSIYYDSADAIHQAMLTAARNKTLKHFTQTLVDGGAEVYSYSGYLSMEFKGEVEGFNVYDVTIEIESSVTVA
jgi:hypothetical protein